MADVETPTIAPAALGRVFLSKLDTETAQALRAAITEELLGLVKDEAVFEARQALTEEFESLKEQTPPRPSLHPCAPKPTVPADTEPMRSGRIP